MKSDLEVEFNMKKSVCIVGGSAAGFYTAQFLAKKGYQVSLFEAEKEINPAARTLIVTSHLRSLCKTLPELSIVNKINRFELVNQGISETVELRTPDLIIDRKPMIQQLAEAARESGVAVHCGHRFEQLRPQHKCAVFKKVQKGTVTIVEKPADILIGADGTNSRVAACGGWPQQPVVSLLQTVVLLPDDIDPGTSRVWFMPERTPYFFWLIPHSATHGVVGITAEDEKHGRLLLNRFLDEQRMIPGEFQIAWTPKYERWIPVQKNIDKMQLYLVGDAAGHVKVTTVGGVVNGILGARGVAESIVNNGKSSSLKILRWELECHRLIRSMLNTFSHNEYQTILSFLTPKTKSALGKYSRDQTHRLLLSLLVNQPHMVAMVIKRLVRFSPVFSSIGHIPEGESVV